MCIQHPFTYQLLFNENLFLVNMRDIYLCNHFMVISSVVERFDSNQSLQKSHHSLNI